MDVKMKVALIVFYLILISSSFALPISSRDHQGESFVGNKAYHSQNLDDLLSAMRIVESNNNPKAVGDNGNAIGVYQIWKPYWKDAVEYDRSIGGKYEDCFDPIYAERVVRAYWRRYAPDNATFEQLARIHNGGCAILRRKGSKAWDNTTKYWNKIQKELRKK